MSWLTTIAVGVVLLATSAWRPALVPREGLTVTDGLGRQVVISAPPRRIVSIFASNTELLCAIGAAPVIVGIESKTVYPPEIRDRALVGGRLGFSAEAIAALHADLVVVTTARHAAANLLDPLTAINVPVLVLRHHDVAQIFANLDLLGRATGREAAAQAAIDELQARLQAVAMWTAERAPVLCYLETGSAGAGAFHSASTGTYTADALRLAGGRSIFPEHRSGLPVSAEAVLRANPEVIIVCGDEHTVAAVAHRPGWEGLRAVRTGRVYAVPRAELLIPGPRIVDGVERMAALLHGP